MFNPKKATLPSGFFNNSGKAGILFKDIFKAMLRHLDVSYNDSCCNESFTSETIGSGGTGATLVIEEEGSSFNTLISANKLLTHIVITGSSFVRIGTTPGGNELFEDTVNPSDYTVVDMPIYFPLATQVYFSGLTGPTTTKIYLK